VEVGGVVEDPEGTSPDQLGLSVAAAQEADAEHPRPPGIMLFRVRVQRRDAHASPFRRKPKNNQPSPARQRLQLNVAFSWGYATGPGFAAYAMLSGAVQVERACAHDQQHSLWGARRGR
jgi:hypothetical protein